MRGKERESVHAGCSFRRVAVMGRREEGSRERRQDFPRKLSTFFLIRRGEPRPHVQEGKGLCDWWRGGY